MADQGGFRLFSEACGTETIDLDKLPGSSLTTSGSFNISGAIWSSTFGKLLGALPIPALVIDRAGRVVVANEACGRIGRKYEKMLHTHFTNLFPDLSQAQQAQKTLEGVFRTRSSGAHVGLLRIDDGQGMWGRITFRSVRIMAARFVLALVEDLTSERRELVANRRQQEKELGEVIEALQEETRRLKKEVAERTRLEKELRRSEEFNRGLVECAPTGIIYLAPDGTVEYVNPCMNRIAGIPEGQVSPWLGLNIFDIPEVKNQPKIRRNLRNVLQGTAQPEIELAFTSSAGVDLTLLAAGSPRFLPDGTASGGVLMISDVSDRRKAEEQLRWNEALLTEMSDSSPFAYFIVDNRTDEILYFNRRFCQIWKIEHLAERMRQGKVKIGDIVPDCAPLLRDVEAFAAVCTPLQNEEDRRVIEDEIEFVDGRKIRRFSTQLRDDRDRYFGRFYLFEDVTEKKRSDELLLQLARQKAVVDLAAGVAHNFNNMLYLVIGNAELALMGLESGDYGRAAASLKAILSGAELGADTVRRLQLGVGTIDSEGPLEKQAIDLSEAARQAIELGKTYWKVVPEKEGIRVHLDARLNGRCPVEGERGELISMILNLIKNAAEALHQDGEIEISTSIDGDWVALTVRDTGIGMCREHLERCFNPFFTTKAQRGAGLSLAVGRQIVQRHGGRITAHSIEGEGTTFTVLLPLSAEAPKPCASSEKVPSHRHTILVVDDVEAVVEMLEEVLTRHNYEVLSAFSGEQAVEIFGANHADLVMCDLGMPGMNGWEVGKTIKEICEKRGTPKPPFVLITGWGGVETEREHIRESAVAAVLGKPLKIQTLLRAVRRLLEKGQH